MFLCYYIHATGSLHACGSISNTPLSEDCQLSTIKQVLLLCCCPWSNFSVNNHAKPDFDKPYTKV